MEYVPDSLLHYPLATLDTLPSISSIVLLTQGPPVCNGSFLATFQDNLSVPSARVKRTHLHSSWTPSHLKIGPIVCSETSARSYHSRLCKVPEERRSHSRGGGSVRPRDVTAVCCAATEPARAVRLSALVQFLWTAAVLIAVRNSCLFHCLACTHLLVQSVLNVVDRRRR